MAQTPTGIGIMEGLKKDKNFQVVGKYFVKLENQRYITVSGTKKCTLPTSYTSIYRVFILGMFSFLFFFSLPIKN